MRPLLFLPAALVSASAASADRPAFDIPRVYHCLGENRSNEPISATVVISGNETHTQFLISPDGGSAWPRQMTLITDLGASYYEGEGNKLWYWVGTNLSLEGDNYGFGFDIGLGRSEPSAALRFSRTRYANGQGPDDPKGAYLDDVSCTADGE